MGKIYKIINDINDKVYIGQTRQTISQRWSMHKQMSKTHPFDLYVAMRQYGVEHFSIKVIESCDDEELDDREIYWIAYYDSYHNGYNMTLGGNHRSYKPSPFQDDIIKTYDAHPDWSYQQIADAVGCSIFPVSSILNRLNKKSIYDKHKGTPVVQYDLNGNFIKEFKSANQAALSLGKKGGHNSIIRVCKQKPGYKTAYGYIWKFKSENLTNSEKTDII